MRQAVRATQQQDAPVVVQSKDYNNHDYTDYGIKSVWQAVNSVNSEPYYSYDSQEGSGQTSDSDRHWEELNRKKRSIHPVILVILR